MMRRLQHKLTGRMATGKFCSDLRAWFQFDKDSGWSEGPAEEFIMLPQQVVSPYSLESFWDYDILPLGEIVGYGIVRTDLGYEHYENNNQETWTVTIEPAYLHFRYEPNAVEILYNLALDQRKKFKVFSPFQMWDFAQGVSVIPAARRKPTYTNNITLGPTDLIEALWEFSPPSLAKLAALSQRRMTGLVELLRLISMGDRVQRGTQLPLSGA